MAVPGSLAPVERVYSNSGLIDCPSILCENVRQVAQVIGVFQVFHLQLTVVMGNVRAMTWLIL